MIGIFVSIHWRPVSGAGGPPATYYILDRVSDIFTDRSSNRWVWR